MREPDDPLKWQDDALCAQVSQEMFFPEKGSSVNAAKKICASCDVRQQCLEYALAMERNPDGVWGGTTLMERRRMRTAAA
jgi:WhiB family redox-sensing transcriptional regulator